MKFQNYDMKLVNNFRATKLGKLQYFYIKKIICTYNAVYNYFYIICRPGSVLTAAKTSIFLLKINI